MKHSVCSLSSGSGALMTKLLVIGGGLLGREVAYVSRDIFDTAVTYNKNPVK